MNLLSRNTGPHTDKYFLLFLKNEKLTVIVWILSFFPVCFVAAQEISWPGEMIRKNKIKSITEWGHSYLYGIEKKDSNRISFRSYDTSANLTEWTYYYLKDQEDTVWEHTTYAYKYDSAGRRIETMQYDSEHYPSHSKETILYADSGKYAISYNYSSWDTINKWVNRYDWMGNLLEEAEYSSGRLYEYNSYVYTYRDNGRVMERKSVIDTLSRVIYRYDERKNKIEETEYRGDTLFRKSSWQYDYCDSLLEKVMVDKNQKTAEKWRYVRDTTGNILKEEWCNMQVKEECFTGVIYAYDSTGNRIEEVRYDLEGNIEKKISWQLNGPKNVASVKIYSPKENIPGELMIRYTEQGVVFESYMFDRYGALEYKVVFRHNEKNLLVEKTELNNKGIPRGRVNYEYEYYE